MVMFAMQLEQYGKVRPNPRDLLIYGIGDAPIEPPIVGQLYIFIPYGTSVNVARALIEEERYVPPPIMASLQICPYFKHLLCEVREGHQETVHFEEMLQREILIIVNLLKILTGQEDEEAVSPIIRDAVIKLRPMSRLDNPLYRTFSVLNELNAYMRISTTAPLQRHFLSMIYYRDMPWMLVSTTVITVDLFEQQRIVRLPSAWVYGVEHKDNAEMRNMSLLLHSVTSHSMLQIFPRLRLMDIPSPYPIMAEILKKASKKYGFRFDPPGYRIDIVRETAWLGIWKQWVMTCDACCYQPAKWMRSDGVGHICDYCH